MMQIGNLLTRICLALLTTLTTFNAILNHDHDARSTTEWMCVTPLTAAMLPLEARHDCLRCESGWYQQFINGNSLGASTFIVVQNL